MAESFRDLYAQITGDTFNAYRPREDGVEGHMYGEATLKRAVEKLQSMPAGPQETYMMSKMTNMGPKKGLFSGGMYDLTPEAGEDYFRNQLDDFRDPDKNNLNVGMDTLKTLLHSGVSPATKMGFARGLFRYLSER